MSILTALAIATNLVYPDPKLTPGAVFTVTTEQVCERGYAGTVRNVPDTEKKQVFQLYGLEWKNRKYYEVDHFISLEIGGSNDITNLWPEPYNGPFNAHEKDLVENYLHSQVCYCYVHPSPNCVAPLTLLQAQQAVVTDWVRVWQQAVAMKLSRHRRH